MFDSDLVAIRSDKLPICLLSEGVVKGDAGAVKTNSLRSELFSLLGKEEMGGDSDVDGGRGGRESLSDEEDGGGRAQNCQTTLYMGRDCRQDRYLFEKGLGRCQNRR